MFHSNQKFEYIKMFNFSFFVTSYRTGAPIARSQKDCRDPNLGKL